VNGSSFDKLVKRIGAPEARDQVFSAASTLYDRYSRVELRIVGEPPVKRSTGEICQTSTDCISNICLPRDITGRTRCL
jgi:hypothetical protein